MKFFYVSLILYIWLVPTELKTLSLPNNKNSEININDIVDDSIPDISQFIINRGLDPLGLPKTQTKLWTNPPNATITNDVEPMIYKADLILNSGKLKRLSSLKRYGDSILSYQNKTVKLDIGCEFPFLQGGYDFTVDMVLFKLRGHVLASAVVRAEAVITFNVTSYKLSLDKYKLQIPGNINVVVENKNGSVDWINTFIINIVIPFFKNTITSAVEKETGNAIRSRFDEINQRRASYVLLK